ncbi:MAG: hypothetical protein B6D39_01185 [Anaerolineae bacterium UTCFX2]|nr:HD domain-containing protein [Anaerolineae bacterium]MCZ7551506.1 HD domain-containing protein [Anaerolineales bacterium]OQY94557.1 MAG: hypothetical protein B6D39_01185 [Anaerolineae bacterium UTCFX2]
MRPIYRIRQFWSALTAAPSEPEAQHLEEVLSPSLMALFRQQPPAEQRHSLKVYARLVAQGENSPELLAAALLHDVGKSRSPLCAWERALVVLVQAAAPDLARRWGSGAQHDAARGWRRSFVVAAQHPAWGAEMARAAGAAPLTVNLILRHQDAPLPVWEAGQEDRLLFILQNQDDNS